MTMAFETKDRSKNDTNFDTCNNYREEVTISTFNCPDRSLQDYNTSPTYRQIYTITKLHIQQNKTI